MKQIKSYRADNISEMEESDIRAKEYIVQLTELDKTGHPGIVTTYNPDGTIEHTYKYQNNEKGQIVDELLFEADNELTQHRSMEYNTEDQLIKESIHYLDGSSDQLLYTYDDKGRILSRKSIDSDGETGNYLVNVYENDLLISESEYDIAGEVITQRKIIYDENDKIIEESFRTPEENYRLLYSYDKIGNASIIRRYNEDKHLTERNTYTYDSDGRVSESMEETSSGIEITYTAYDDTGNIVLQEEKTENGELLSRIERTYDNENRPLVTNVFFNRPGQGPKHYRTRLEYE